MKRQAFLTTIPMSLVATVIFVVACGPTKDYVPVLTAPRSALGEAVDRCKADIANNKEVRVGGSVNTAGVLENAMSVNICEATPDPDSAENQIYKFKPYNVRYRVRNIDGRFKVSLNVAIDLPSDLSHDVQESIRDVLYNQCLKDLNVIWRRSIVDIAADLEVRFGSVSNPRFMERDQVLPLVQVASGASDEPPAFVMGPWPERGVLYPQGRIEDIEMCRKQSKNETYLAQTRLDKTEVFNECMSKAKRKSNAQFCVSFAKRLGQYLGLKGDAAFNKRCVAQMSEAERTELKALKIQSKNEKQTTTRRDQQVSLMKASTDTLASGEEFWKKAKLSGDEIVTILSPACPSVAQLKRDAR